ncbi:uncharacterized protein E5676_scaffold119G00730 [Cucumis melo var. makuwa]|uniref:Uncharacterized protein n=1 Tax=Cucumis melo var. makuwa TaxID=1194695 RepID=A0A5D3D4T9_CUCMM|nr:uncharacterized protein E5676_scaffold119G00730 [Cucumis melo var. makuwa]
MFLHGRTIDHYVIQVDYYEFIEIFVEDLVHQRIEGGRGIGETKWHYEEFERTISGDTGCLRLISLCNSYLVVPRPQV